MGKSYWRFVRKPKGKFCEKPRQQTLPGLLSGGKIFKNGKPAFLHGGVVLFLGLQGPGDALEFPELPAQVVADGLLPVAVAVGDEVRHTGEVQHIVGQQEFEVIRQIAAGTHIPVGKQAPDQMGSVLLQPGDAAGVKALHAVFCLKAVKTIHGGGCQCRTDNCG